MKRWRFLPADETVVRNLRDALQIDPLFCKLLAQRGVRSMDEARVFLRPTLSQLHDPFLMKDMSLAVERFDRALRNNERILLYGDYDVDGTTSVALMYAFLSTFYRNVDYYLPDRDKEGYGVSLAGVEYARQTGCSLVIAMDCGIKAHEAIAKAGSYDIDFIVCDHHLPEGELPAAVANLDPKRPDCPYPYKDLSGCGIAFKLAQALALYNHTPAQELEHLLDLVAISIACDIVPMTGENRVLAHFGLQQLNREPRIGLWALISQTKRQYPLDVNDLVFGLGPLINAAGRLGDARDAVKLLLAVERQSALDAATALVRRNRSRQEVDYSTTEVARERFTALPDWESKKSVFMFDPEWHKGIIGITASRMSEAFHRPAVILTLSEGRAVGSARSVPGFDLYEALQRCEHLFYSFGGHAHAAGMQLPVAHIEAFETAFEAAVHACMTPDAESPIVELCGLLDLRGITPEFWRMLRRFSPFGPENRNPVFVARKVRDTGKSKILDKNHVRLSIAQDDGATITGIGFGLAEAFSAVQDGFFDIAFNIHESQWQGKSVLSIYAKDFRPSE